jgi:putative MATE family efflux protein
VTIDAVPTGKKHAYNRDWTQGPVVRNILLLSWPMALMETLFVVSQVADMVWVGRLGKDAIAGMGIAFTVVMLAMTMDFGLMVGSRAMVARFVGAGDTRTANHVAAQGLLLGIAWGILMTVLGIVFTGPLVRLFHQNPTVTADAVSYIRITFAGWLTMDIMVVILYVVQASGDPIRPLMIEGITRIIHITLCPFLVLGLWIFPKMGVGGSALASIIGQIVGAALALWLFFSGATRLHVSARDFRIDLGIIGRILKIGLPSVLTNMQRSLATFIITLLIAPFGTVAMAAQSLYSRVEMFIMLPGFGLGMGSGVLVGQNLGAKQPERAVKTAWIATGILQALMVVVCAVLLIWANGIISLFTTDPEVIKMGASFLRIASVGFFVISFQSILQGAINGAGDTVPNLLISFFSMWIIQVPLALWLPHIHNLEALGIRWALVTGSVIATAIYVVYFSSGRWKTKKV